MATGLFLVARGLSVEEHPLSNVDEINIRFPARKGYLYLSRLNASAVASEAGFNIDELDDIRLAVNELVSWLLHDADGEGYVELVMSARDEQLSIRGSRTAESELPPRELDEFVSAMLGATVDDFTVGETGRTLELSKSRTR